MNPGTLDPNAPGCEGVQPITPTPLRRLTRFEYNNTVQDLLGVTLTPADQFPPDEIAGGFNNNASVLTVSPLHAEKYTEAAELLAAEAVKNLSTLVACDPAALGEEACAQQFVQTFGRRAFRRPITPEESDRLMRAYTAGRTGGTFAEGIEVVIRYALQAPAFLYRLESSGAPSADQRIPLSQYELATRLSYLLWGSTPDDALLAAAEAGELSTKEQIATRARAMLTDARARRAIAEFFRQWMNLGKLDTLVKSATAFPLFDDAVRAGMKAETQAFIEHVLWTGDRKLTSLLTLPIGFPNEALARVYGVTVPAGSTGPTQVALPAEQRSGILTMPGFLAVHAHPDQTSPVLRGKFVREKMLCQPPPPPPPDANVTLPPAESGTSARARFTAHSADPACSGCHQLMDPIGFAFENFDSIGTYRTMDGTEPVDASGELVETDVDSSFVGVRELTTLLASSQMVQDCLATQWFRFGSGRFDTEQDACMLQDIQSAFRDSGGDLIEMIVALTQTDSFLYRPVLSEEVAP